MSTLIFWHKFLTWFQKTLTSPVSATPTFHFSRVPTSFLFQTYCFFFLDVLCRLLHSWVLRLGLSTNVAIWKWSSLAYPTKVAPWKPFSWNSSASSPICHFEDGFVGNFLHVTIVCSDCIPGETRVRAGMALESEVTRQFPVCGKKRVSFVCRRETPKISLWIWGRST